MHAYPYMLWLVKHMRHESSVMTSRLGPIKERKNVTLLSEKEIPKLARNKTEFLLNVEINFYCVGNECIVQCPWHVYCIRSMHSQNAINYFIDMLTICGWHGICMRRCRCCSDGIYREEIKCAPLFGVFCSLKLMVSWFYRAFENWWQ